MLALTIERTMSIQETTQKIITILQEATASLTPPLIDQLIAIYGRDPYLILIACLISLRAQDKTTIHICKDLFARVTTPEQMVALSVQELETILFKSGFYRQKAKILQTVSAELILKHGSRVPADEEALRALPGVGPKTANLVLGMAFGQPAICVDTHVHRISNRLGLIATDTVEMTERALKKLLKRNDWIRWNKLLVIWGQNRCVPLSPRCSSCPLRTHCKRVGVTRSR